MNKNCGIISPVVAFIPFLEKNDVIRLHTGANLSKQACSLANPDIPFCITGTEDMILNGSSFISLAKDDGKVLFKNDMVLMVEYANGKNELISLEDEELSYNTTNSKICNLQANDVFKKDSILVSGGCCKDGRLAMGANLKIAFGVWKGYNFEDAIVISESASKKLAHYSTNSVEIYLAPNEYLNNTFGDEENYKPLPEIGVEIKNRLLASKSCVDDSNVDVLFTASEETPEFLDDEGFAISDIKIFVNDYFKLHPKWAEWVEQTIALQVSREKQTYSAIEKLCSDKEALKQFVLQRPALSNMGNYTTKDGEFSGLFIYVTLKKLCPVEVGDKLANRHGNKGIVSLVVPDSKMPLTEEGNRVEILLNTLGVISRMNVGQFYELHMSEVCKRISDQFSSTKPENVKEKIKELLPYLDGTDTKWYTSQVLEFLEHTRPEDILEDIKRNGFICVQPPFESMSYEQIVSIMEKYDVKDISTLYYDETKIGRAAVGYMHVMKLHHIAKSKQYGRSVGNYTVKYNQPVGGRNNQGGNRLGEMEIWALIAHELDCNLKESLTIKSDDVDGRKRLLNSIIKGEDDLFVVQDSKSVAVDSFKSYFQAIGLMLEDKHIDVGGV